MDKAGHLPSRFDSLRAINSLDFLQSFNYTDCTMKITTKKSKSIRLVAESYEDRCLLTEISRKMNNNACYHEYIDTSAFDRHERVTELTLCITEPVNS